MKKKFEILMIACLFASSFFLARAGAALVSSKNADNSKPCIVLDAGHGSGNLRKVTKASKYKKKGNRYPLLHQLLNRA